MKRLFALSTSLALSLCRSGRSTHTPRPGQGRDVAIGYTVWQGDKIEEFKANHRRARKSRSRRDRFWKARRRTAAQTGVIAGMSGSPVYSMVSSSAPCRIRSVLLEGTIAGITPIAR